MKIRRDIKTGLFPDIDSKMTWKWMRPMKIKASTSSINQIMNIQQLLLSTRLKQERIVKELSSSIIKELLIQRSKKEEIRSIAKRIPYIDFLRLND